MSAEEALRCECGYEVRASDEAARVDEVRRHASETHGIDLSPDVALDVVRRGAAGSSTPERLAALNARGDALNRQHGLGDYAAKRDAGGATVGKRKS